MKKRGRLILIIAVIIVIIIVVLTIFKFAQLGLSLSPGVVACTDITSHPEDAGCARNQFCVASNFNSGTTLNFVDNSGKTIARYVPMCSNSAVISRDTSRPMSPFREGCTEGAICKKRTSTDMIKGVCTDGDCIVAGDEGSSCNKPPLKSNGIWISRDTNKPGQSSKICAKSGVIVSILSMTTTGTGWTGIYNFNKPSYRQGCNNPQVKFAISHQENNPVEIRCDSNFNPARGFIADGICDSDDQENYYCNTGKGPCKDNDITNDYKDGKNPIQQGNTQDLVSGNIYKDVCVYSPPNFPFKIKNNIAFSDKIKEYYCDSSAKVKSEVINCPQGLVCPNGGDICVNPTQIDCRDYHAYDKNWKEISKSLVIDKNGNSFTDTCKDRNTVIVGYCSPSGNIAKKESSCSSGAYCENGACISSYWGECFDTSGRYGYYVPSVAAINKKNFNTNQGQIVASICKDDNTLLKSYCYTESEIKIEEFKCPDGCENIEFILPVVLQSGFTGHSDKELAGRCKVSGNK